jgi:flagellar basal body-associated protein FliL
MPDVQVSPAPKSSKGWLIAVLALGLAAAGIFIWLRPEHSAGATVESTMALETFVVNLNDSGQRAYLRVGITLGLSQPLPHNKADSIPTALMRDTILSVLATAQPEELLKVEGKRQLKDKVLKALQERAPQLAVSNVYFTEFLVQM